MTTDTVLLPTPRLRGRVHQAAFVASLLGLAWLVVLANGTKEIVSAAVYGTAMVLLYLVSSTYHVFARGPRFRPVMRRLDHSMIFVLIAGTYTPVCLIALHGAWGWGLLIAVWTGALIGITLKVAGLEKYRKLSAPLYIVLGWLAVVATPSSSTGPTCSRWRWRAASSTRSGRSCSPRSGPAGSRSGGATTSGGTPSRWWPGSASSR